MGFFFVPTTALLGYAQVRALRALRVHVVHVRAGDCLLGWASQAAHKAGGNTMCLITWMLSKELLCLWPLPQIARIGSCVFLVLAMVRILDVVHRVSADGSTQQPLSCLYITEACIKCSGELSQRTLILPAQVPAHRLSSICPPLNNPCRHRTGSRSKHVPTLVCGCSWSSLPSLFSALA